MPHVIAKLRPGMSRERKAGLAEAISQDVMKILGYGEESASVGFEEARAAAWRGQVFQPHIVATDSTLFEKPGHPR